MRYIVIASLLALSFTTGFTCSKNTPEQTPAPVETAPPAEMTPPTEVAPPAEAPAGEAAPAAPTH